MWPTRDKLGPDALSKLEAFYGDHKSSRSFYTASKLIFCIRCKATKKEIEALVADILANVVPDEGLAGFGNI